MRINSSTLLATLSKATISKITNEVKETIAYVMVPVPVKSFTSADMWNIRRRQRTALSRRSCL